MHPVDDHAAAAAGGDERLTFIRDPWQSGTAYALDRAAPLEPGCRVAIEVAYGDDGAVCWLPGRLETEVPGEAEVLDVIVVGADGEARGTRRCERRHVVRLTKLIRDI
jgi:hypothetical protein